jgi:chromosome segregation ATPase
MKMIARTLYKQLNQIKKGVRMVEKTKEEYNKKIGELYSVIENQEKIIRDLQENYNNELDEKDLLIKNLEDKLNTQRKYYQNRLMKIQQKNEQLQQRIDKAIKYIKENQKEYGSLLDNEKIILGILKGGNND